MTLLVVGLWCIGATLVVFICRANALREDAMADMRDYGDETDDLHSIPPHITEHISPFGITQSHSPTTPWIGLTQAERDLWLDATGFHEERTP